MDLKTFLIWWVVIIIYPAARPNQTQTPTDSYLAMLQKKTVQKQHLCNYTDYSFMVVIAAAGLPKLCYGSLVTLQIVLTVARCINKEKIAADKSWMQVKTGFLYDELPGYTWFVEKGIVHPLFNPRYVDCEQHAHLHYDIGLLVLSDPLKESRIIKPARLPIEGVTDKCTFGRTFENWDFNVLKYPYQGNYSKLLGCGDQFILKELTQCSFSWHSPNSKINETIICSKWHEGGQFICPSTYGAPFLCLNQQIGVVIGVLSKLTDCAELEDKMPTHAYTRVEPHIDWLRSEIYKSSAHLEIIGIKKILTISICVLLHRQIF